MRLTPRQRAVLLGIAADVEHFSNRKLPANLNAWQAANEQMRIDDAKDGIVLSTPAKWLGKALTQSDYVLLSRDYRRLESLGLVERAALGHDRKRTTHFLLSDTGRELAASLIQPTCTHETNGN